MAMTCSSWSVCWSDWLGELVSSPYSDASTTWSVSLVHCCCRQCFDSFLHTQFDYNRHPLTFKSMHPQSFVSLRVNIQLDSTESSWSTKRSREPSVWWEPNYLFRTFRKLEFQHLSGKTSREVVCYHSNLSLADHRVDMEGRKRTSKVEATGSINWTMSKKRNRHKPRKPVNKSDKKVHSIEFVHNKLGAKR